MAARRARSTRASRSRKSEIVVALDADTQFEPKTIARLARWFAADERLGAVAGNAKVGNRVNLVTRWQALEYVTAQNLERRALARLDAMTVVPGAVGAWRKQAIVEVGGYPPETLAEDQDLTIAVQRAGWRVAYDQSAIAWTEAPQTLAPARPAALPLGVRHDAVPVEAQARSWRRARPRGLALIGLPQAILFQLLFALISPIIDLALVVNIISTVTSIHEHGYTAVKGDLHRVALVLAAVRGDRPDRRADRLRAGAARELAADGVADPAALRLPPGHVLRRDQGRHPGAARAARRLVVDRAIGACTWPPRDRRSGEDASSWLREELRPPTSG